MSRRDPISAEIIRGELRRDCESAGYTPGAAGRLADRIVDGWITPGLAVAVGGGAKLLPPVNARHGRQTAEAT